jgi:hypothetical protein
LTKGRGHGTTHSDGRVICPQPDANYTAVASISAKGGKAPIFDNFGGRRRGGWLRTVRETVPSREPFPSTLSRQVPYLDHGRRLRDHHSSGGQGIEVTASPASLRICHRANTLGLAKALADLLLGSSAFRLSTTAVVDVARGLVLLYGIGTSALPSWDPRMGWSNLMGGLAGSGRQVQADMRTHLIHRPARNTIPPPGGARVSSYCDWS